MTESVKVIVRSRPLLGQEVKNRCRNIVEIEKGMQQVTISDPQEEIKDASTSKTFRFDEVFDTQSTQQQVYDEAAFQIIEAAAEGYNGMSFFSDLFQVQFLLMAKQVVVKHIP